MHSLDVVLRDAETPERQLATALQGLLDLEEIVAALGHVVFPLDVVASELLLSPISVVSLGGYLLRMKVGDVNIQHGNDRVQLPVGKKLALGSEDVLVNLLSIRLL